MMKMMEMFFDTMMKMAKQPTKLPFQTFDEDYSSTRSFSNNNDERFRIELALSRIQSYYSRAMKYTGEFEEDLSDNIQEFETACKGQSVPDEHKSEMFRLSVSGRALTYYKSISGANIPWEDLKKRFHGHFMSCLLYTSPSPRDQRGSRMPSSA